MEWSDKAWHFMKRSAYVAWRKGMNEIELHWMATRAWEELRERDRQEWADRLVKDMDGLAKKSRQRNTTL